MDFTLTEEQLMAQEMVREFAQKEIYPTIKEWDRKHEPHPKVLSRMAELGILGINIPVRYGGQGFDYITLALVCEELERVDARPAQHAHLGEQLVEPLSEREIEVLRLIASGCSNKEIARELILAIGTVKRHTANIFNKLDVRNRTEAVARARELDLL